jgi:spore germination protein YaaH
MRIFILIFTSFCAIFLSLFVVSFLNGDNVRQVPIEQVTTREDSRGKLSEYIGFLPYWNANSLFPVYASYFSHIMYFGITVDSMGRLIRSGTEWNVLNSSYVFDFIRALDRDKTKFSIVVKQFDGDTINEFIADPDASTRLSSDLINLVAQFNLDGINFDFEFDGSSQSLDSEKFALFIEEVSTALRKENKNIILSLDLSGQIIEKEKSYDLVRIGKAMDFVIIMGYDYKTPSSPFAGPVAPILGEANEHSIAEAVAFVSSKIPSDKIVLGMPLYGYEWETRDESFKSSAIAKSGALASYSRASNILRENKNIKVQWDEKAKSPWFVYEDKGATKQIYFENEKSLLEKIKFAQEMNLKGAAFWALGYEGDNEGFWKSLTGL